MKNLVKSIENMVFGKEFDVKNTTFGLMDWVFDWISPLLCRGCGTKGSYLCECCKKYIMEKMKARNLVTSEETKDVFARARYLGYRDEMLGELVEEYKYESARGLARVIAEVVAEGLERGGLVGSEPVVLIPYPTNRKHIRERGFDHVDLVCRGAAKRTRVEVVRMLRRENNTTQVGASREQRRVQAKTAVSIDARYLTKGGRLRAEYRKRRLVLVDDVWTTGASLLEAGKMLRRAGAEDVCALAIVKARTEKSPVIRHGDFDDADSERRD